MFSIGLPEFLLVTVAILIFVGPERMPQVARWCGRMIARGRVMVRDIQRELERNAELQDLKKTGVDIRDDITGVVQEFGKISEEVSGDMKRLGESFSLEQSESRSGPQEVANAARKGPEPEEQFLDEVEIIRRARQVPGGHKEPATTPAVSKPDLGSDNG